MTLPLTLSIFWLCSIIWGICLWYQGSAQNTDYDAIRKVAFKLDSCQRHSVSSIDSLNESDDEAAEEKARRLRYETKTRWPSRTSVKEL